MTVRDVIDYMETIAPPGLAAEWDNVGLLCGDPNAPVTAVVTALDATPAVIAYAQSVGAGLIITHHPAIFAPLSSLPADHPVYQAAAAGIALYAAHTNLDAAAGGVNDVLAAAIGLQNVQPAFDGMGRVGELLVPCSPEEWAAQVANALHTSVQWRAGNRPVARVAICSGAGGEFAAEAAALVADAFLTGEMKHHEWLEAPHDLTMCVAGHHATEVPVVPVLAAKLRERFASLKVEAFDDRPPYQTMTNKGE